MPVWEFLDWVNYGVKTYSECRHLHLSARVLDKVGTGERKREHTEFQHLPLAPNHGYNVASTSSPCSHDFPVTVECIVICELK